MAKRHLKRLNAPKTWKIQRRGIKFTVKSNPGGMSKDLTMPVSNVLKHELHLAHSTKEVKHLIVSQNIMVNGVRITDYRYPLCFTDVLSIPESNIYYRLIIDTDGILKLLPITKDESTFKIVKIIGKSFINGKIQLNLMDGRNVLFEKQHYKVKDSLLISVPDQLVKEHLSFEKGALVLLYKGKHIGKVGKIEDTKKDSIIVKSKDVEFETSKEYALVIGRDSSKIKMTN